MSKEPRGKIGNVITIILTITVFYFVALIKSHSIAVGNRSLPHFITSILAVGIVFALSGCIAWSAFTALRTGIAIYGGYGPSKIKKTTDPKLFRFIVCAQFTLSFIVFGILLFLLVKTSPF